MTYFLCFVVGALTGALLTAYRRRPPKQTARPIDTVEAELRRARKALREYQNFMTYDGFSSQGEENE